MSENQVPEIQLKDGEEKEIQDHMDHNDHGEQTLPVLNGGNIKYLDMVEFDNRFNDDIFRLVLSFLAVRDLGRVERVSKHLRLSQLCGEDSEIWRKAYEKKVTELHEILKKSGAIYENPILPFLGKKSDFKSSICGALKVFDTLVEKKSSVRMEDIERSIKNYPTTGIKNIFVPKDELLKFDISSAVYKKKEEGIKLLALGRFSLRIIDSYYKGMELLEKLV